MWLLYQTANIHVVKMLAFILWQCNSCFINFFLSPLFMLDPYSILIQHSGIVNRPHLEARLIDLNDFILNIAVSNTENFSIKWVKSLQIKAKESGRYCFKSINVKACLRKWGHQFYTGHHNHIFEDILHLKGYPVQIRLHD